MLKQISHWWTSQCVPFTEGSLRCYWNHCLTTASTLSSDPSRKSMSVLRELNAWKLHSEGFRLYERQFGTFQCIEQCLGQCGPGCCHTIWHPSWSCWDTFSWWQYEGLLSVSQQGCVLMMMSVSLSDSISGPVWTDSVPRMLAFNCFMLFLFALMCPFCCSAYVHAQNRPIHQEGDIHAPAKQK